MRQYAYFIYLVTFSSDQYFYPELKLKIKHYQVTWFDGTIYYVLILTAKAVKAWADFVTLIIKY